MDSALLLFETRGFEGVAVPEIAKDAGVATGTVYLYFKDKLALVNALYRHWKAAYNDFVLAAPPAGATPRQVFSHHWQRMTLFARTHPRAVRFMDLHHHTAYLDADSRAMSREYLDVAHGFIRDARAQGAIRDVDPMMVVALMWGAAAALVKFSAADALVFDQDNATAMEDALWRAIKAQGDDHGSQAQG